MISATRLGAIALLAGALVSIAMPANATLKTCYGSVDAVGRGATMPLAFNKAKINWTNKVAATYGISFADLNNAEDPGRSCNATGGLTYCRVHAKPCTAGSDFDGGVNKKPVYD